MAGLLAVLSTSLPLVALREEGEAVNEVTNNTFRFHAIALRNCLELWGLVTCRLGATSLLLAQQRLLRPVVGIPQPDDSVYPSHL